MRDFHLEAVATPLTTLTANDLYRETERKKKSKNKQQTTNERARTSGWMDKNHIYHVELALGERRQTLTLRDRDKGQGRHGHIPPLPDARRRPRSSTKDRCADALNPLAFGEQTQSNLDPDMPAMSPE
jgi:hypothetical protein